MVQNVNIINLYEWDVTPDDFTKWVKESCGNVYSMNKVGATVSITSYAFEKEEDYTAFMLKFQKRKPHQMDAGFFYAPYIPLGISVTSVPTRNKEIKVVSGHEKDKND